MSVIIFRPSCLATNFWHDYLMHHDKLGDMKKSALLAIALVAGLSASMAQSKSTWGIKGGLNFPMDGFTFKQTGENINSIFTEEKRATGWHAGIFGRAYLGRQFYLGSNLMYLHNTNTLIGKTAESAVTVADFNRSGSMMDLVAGIEMLNFLRIQGGLNGMVYFDDSWQDTFNTFGTGYTFGVGVDLWRITLDVSYYGSFKDHAGQWNGVPLSYNRSDLLVGIGFKF